MAYEVAHRSVSGSEHAYQDRVLVDRVAGLFAVADGVTNSGPGRDGGRAAEEAIKALRRAYTSARGVEMAVREANNELVGMVRRIGGLGYTTLTAAALRDDRLVVANVGDSPAYALGGGRLRRLYTEDKNMRGGLMQVIGMEGAIVHRAEHRMRRGDIAIIASDGMDRVLNEHDLSRALGSAGSLEKALVGLFRALDAKPTGYDDDKSIIVIRSR